MSRKLSWVFAAAAYLGPPLWAYFAIEADVNAQRTAYGFVKCGNAAVSISVLACIVTAVLSLAATCMGLANFRSLGKPRPKVLVLEMAVLFSPFALAGILFVSIVWP